MEPETRTKPQPVLVLMSFLVALDVIVSGAALSDILSPKVVGLMLLVMAAIKVGTAYYLRGQVVPLADVGAYLTERNRMVAGPASTVPDDHPVQVRATATYTSDGA